VGAAVRFSSSLVGASPARRTVALLRRVSRDGRRAKAGGRRRVGGRRGARLTRSADGDEPRAEAPGIGGATRAGRSVLATSSKVALQRQVPLARRAGLAFDVRLPERRQIETVQEILLVPDVRRADRDEPPAVRARPLD